MTPKEISQPNEDERSEKFHSEISLENVLIAGMPQAGSTLCFNLIRLLLEKASHTLFIHFPASPDGQTEHLHHPGTSNRVFQLMKQHFLPPESACWKSHGIACRDWRIFVVKRDLRDTIASAIRKDPPLAEDILSICARNIEWYTSSCKIPAKIYEWTYEEYQSDPLASLYKLRNQLRSNTPLKELPRILEQIETLKKEALANDPEHNKILWKVARMRADHFTNNGIIGGYKGTLTKQQIEDIEREYGCWLKKHGYMD